MFLQLLTTRRRRPLTTHNEHESRAEAAATPTVAVVERQQQRFLLIRKIESAWKVKKEGKTTSAQCVSHKELVSAGKLDFIWLLYRSFFRLYLKVINLRFIIIVLSDNLKKNFLIGICSPEEFSVKLIS